MSLLGIDVGTTGVKVAAYDLHGVPLASAYREFTILHPQQGCAELDAEASWQLIVDALGQVCSTISSDPPIALCVSSLGEAVVPVSKDRRILGRSILNFDVRGREAVETIRSQITDAELFELNGNIAGNHYGLSKLMFIAKYKPELYGQTYKFLPWGSFVSFMLGSDPCVDYSLANRLLLLDIKNECWSSKMLQISGIAPEKLPDLVQSGSVIGYTSNQFASIGLPEDVAIVAGGHDQCMNAIGCGVIEEGRAMYGMGTFLCAVPVYKERPKSEKMLERGLNVEHHVVADRYVSFLYNQGGSVLKWFRDTFAAEETRQARESGSDIYTKLLSEMPAGPSRLMVVPHFTVTGPPKYISNSSGMIAGLTLETTRGQICKAVLECVTFYMRDLLEQFEGMGIPIDRYNAVGGGAASDAWLQLSANILGKTFLRPQVTEAGTLGAALNAGLGVKVYRYQLEARAQTVRLIKEFDPDPDEHRRYKEWFEAYKETISQQGEYLASIGAKQ